MTTSGAVENLEMKYVILMSTCFENLHSYAMGIMTSFLGLFC